MILHEHEREVLERVVDQADFFATWINTVIAEWDSGQGVSFNNADKTRVAQLIGAVNEARAVLAGSKERTEKTSC